MRRLITMGLLWEQGYYLPFRLMRLWGSPDLRYCLSLN